MFCFAFLFFYIKNRRSIFKQNYWPTHIPKLCFEAFILKIQHSLLTFEIFLFKHYSFVFNGHLDMSEMGKWGFVDFLGIAYFVIQLSDFSGTMHKLANSYMAKGFINSFHACHPHQLVAIPKIEHF